MINTLFPEAGIFQSPAVSRSLVIVGLPASGKTSYARSLLEGCSHYEDIHHWLYYRDQHVRNGDDRFGRFLADLEAGRPWVIDSVEMCEREVREYLTRSGEVEWLFFENDPHKCRSNAQALEHRGEGYRAHRLREIERVTVVYDVPEGVIMRPVYRSPERMGGLAEHQSRLTMVEAPPWWGCALSSNLERATRSWHRRRRRQVRERLEPLVSVRHISCLSRGQTSPRIGFSLPERNGKWRW